MRRTIVLLTMVGMLAPLVAHAFNEHVWLMINGGHGTYDMSDLNQEITAINEANSGSGFIYPLVKNGNSFGLAAGFDASHGWTYGFGMDRLHAVTKAGDANGSLEYQFNANAWHAFAERPVLAGARASFMLGAGIGIIAESGKVIESQPNVAPLNYKLSGSSPMYEAHAGANWWATSQFALVATAGYRYAKIKTVKLEGDPFIKSNGEALPVDYSGPYARVGFKLAGKNVSD
jgi:hypothetical protein